jgi:predicted amidohydrolase YtcJ
VLIADAEIDGGPPRDLRIEAGVIAAIGERLPLVAGEERLCAAGGALLPGLHDHHLHLFALAAAQRSLRCGPPTIRSATELGEHLARARRDTPPKQWIRGVGYHESVAGPLDRTRLDAWVPDRPVRIQQRSGALWILNSEALGRLGIESAHHAGLERDAGGEPTGRLRRADDWLRERIGDEAPPSLDGVGRILARRGVTGVTDATPSNGAAEVRALEHALEERELPQRVHLMGSPALPIPASDRLTRGAVKLLIDEASLPDFDALCAAIAAAHDEGRGAAVHCVTRTELVFTASAFASAGCLPGDRIEHAAVADPASLSLLASLPLTVVTQPNFVAERGDAYRRDVPATDHPYLYRCRGFDDAGISLGGGTDAPFGEPDPWSAMRAAVDRRAPDGGTLGPGEAITPERALALFTSPAEAPGAAARSIAIGAPADLCLLDRPWREARRELRADAVAATICNGALVWPA